MTPMIAATAHSGWQRLTPLLEAAGLSDPARAEAAHDEVEARLRGADTPTALLLCTRPERLLVQAMEQDEDPAARLDTWLDSARTFLQAYRRNRRNAVIVDVDEALAAPSAFLDTCARKFSLAVPETIPAPAQAEEQASTPDPVHALIAAQWVAADSDAVPLLEELEASRTPLAESGSQPHADAAWQAYRETCSRAADESRVQDLQEENELLLLQLHQVQEELESYFLELRDEQAKRTRAEETVKKRDQTIRNKNAAIDKKEEKYQHMLAQKKNLDRQLHALRHSRSWRMTAPIRALRRRPRIVR